ncbi:LytR/AlgR family response regulator transcription factor [Paenibacillus tarimensis]|uniref:LytR/AlgR family response regulator transcription factor n=1 Tax=Paenibacillus tarimensis TaxID=416012 RepID=UPI001F1A4869|nr:LytTR family DNA-binding domain-containing protein [Paenibacillus tarimensis]MCF2943625.1 LytTR family DNA-binding domain-containing protein [Paenibacillus tarimensis]
MSTLQVVIAEDNSGARDILTRFLETFEQVEMIGAASDGEQLVRLVLQKRPHLVLADISMPGISGLEAVRECLRLLPELLVVFVTAYDQYAVEAFEIQAFDYIVKPVQIVRLAQVIERAKRAVQTLPAVPPLGQTVPAEQEAKVMIQSSRAIHFIPLDDILFIEKVGRKTVVHTRAATFETYESLASVMKKLGPGFVQSHRAYIIHLRHVLTIKPCGESVLVHFYDYEPTAYTSRDKLNEIMDRLVSG